MENNGVVHLSKLSPVEQLQATPTEFLIVAIGASAGGVQALQEFFRQVPQNSGMAYVVILHLYPDYDSQLAEILQRETSVPIMQVTEKTFIRPDHIYVVPPNQHLMIEDDYIAVSPNLNIEDRRAPVDIFFRTLADQYGPRAISVILSGTGADGSMGLKRVKERGGAVFVQNPREAVFNEMPRNAIATNLVDEVLNVTDIPAKIISYRDNTGKVQIMAEIEERPEDQQHALREIFTLLRHNTGHDFSNYKRPTLMRRIERRISMRNLPDLPAYARFLKENVDEPTALLKDLLISVTNFFRDKKAFEIVEQEIIPQIINGKHADGQVRIWVAGCATGEEAYSFAMLCLEKTIGLIDVPKIQIFATDIDEAAIAHARDGVYTINDLADVSQERLQRFFNKEEEGYRIRREVRETIMFAVHNVLKDPPFSHLDLVSCRNVMIYLNQVAQERVVATFHFALNPGCYLFLGNSESVDGSNDLYATFNRDYHIFQSRQVSPIAYPVPESTPTLYFDKFKKDTFSQEQETKILERISFGDLHQQLLEEYAPPSLVVNEDYDILHLTERAGKYLQIGGGELSQNVLKLAKPELRLELRSALYQAVQRQAAVEAKGLKITIGDKTEIFNIQVRPVLRPGNMAKGFILIVFEPAADDSAKEVVLSSDEPVARQLEEELIRVKAQLRTANEQHDFQAEEMKASNEELQAMNEELRSAAEELETSKEELQSINEELHTVNQELKVKIEATSISSNNLQNLINSTNIGTIFLDRNFRVALFTPAVREIFNLRNTDYGRPLSDITGSLEYENLLQDAENVLEKLIEFETEVSTRNGSIYLMRITPYRTDEDRIRGVVITFVDVTLRKKADEALRKSEENYAALFAGSPVPFMVIDAKPPEFIITAANNAYFAATLTTREGLIGRKLFDVFTDDPNRQGQLGSEALDKSLQRVLATKKPDAMPRTRYDIVTPGGGFEPHWWLAINAPLLDASGEVSTIIHQVTRVTELHLAEEAERKNVEQQALLLQLSDMLQTMGNPVQMQDAAMRLLSGQLGLSRAYYFNVEQDDHGWVHVIENAGQPEFGEPGMVGKHSLKTFGSWVFDGLDKGKVINVPDVAAVAGLTEGELAAYREIGVAAFLNVPLLKNGSYGAGIAVHSTLPRNWTSTEIDLIREVAVRTWDKVERAKAEKALRQSEEQVKTILEGVGEPFYALDQNWRFLFVSQSALKMWGKEQDQVLGQLFLECFPQAKDSPAHEIHRRVMLSGVAEHAETFSPVLNKWIESDIARTREGGLSVAFRDIEQRKLAEVALRENEERYRELFESIDEGYCIVEMIFDGNTPVDYRFIEVNPAFEYHTGIVNAKGRLMRDIAPAHEQHWFDYYGEVALTGQPKRFEAPAKALGDRWYDFNAFRVGEPEQRRVAIVFSDITERKRQEQRLQEFNNRLEQEVAERTRELHSNYALVQTIYDTTLIGMSVLIPVKNAESQITDFRVIAANKKIEQASGRNGLTGLLYSELFPGVKKTELFTLMVNTIETGEIGQLEHSYTYEGVDTWYATMLVKGEDLLVSTDIDITERKRLEDKRLSTYMLLQQSEELAGMGSWDYDLLTGSFSWSDGMYRLFNLEKHIEVRPEIYLQYVTADCKETANQVVRHIENGDLEFEETLTLQVDESVKIVRLKATVVKNDKGHPVRMLGVDMDVTASREAEEKFRQLKIEQQLEIFRVTLRTQEEERRRISESLHNGLGQLLYGIKMSISQLSIQQALKNPEEFESSRRYTSDLLSDAIRDSRLISHELMPAVLEEFGLKAAVNDACKQLQDGTKFKCSVNLGNVEIDRYTQLAVFRTVQELMTNVIKHASATIAEVKIVVVNEEILLQVSDNGNGIGQDIQGKDGIGLASIKSKVDLLNGRFEIISLAGEGTTVKISLPYKPQIEK